MEMPTTYRWLETHTSDRISCAICKTCGGSGWLKFSCGTPWRCKCNQSSALTPPRHPMYPYYVSDRE